MLIVLIFFSSASFAQELVVITDKPKYLRYELVEVKAKIDKESKIPFFKSNNNKNKKVTATFFCNDKQIESAGSLKELILNYDEKQDCWIKKWPIPWSPVLGKYTVKVTVENNVLEQKKDDKPDAVPENLSPDNSSKNSKNKDLIEVSASFLIEGKTAMKLPNGFCVLTLEGRPDLYPRKYPSPVGDKTTKSWENIVEWSKYTGVDAIWSLVGQTQIWGKKKPKDYPWEDIAIDMMYKISKRAKENGLQYGGWITSYAILGDNPWGSDYKFSIGYDTKTKQLKKIQFASFEDPKRKEEIIKLLQVMDKNPNVSYVGLDYIRAGFGGFEYVDSFVEEMSIPVPLNFHKLSKDDRMKWLGAKILARKDSIVYRRWEWWRAHKFAELIKSIMEESKIQKPLWTFTLGWEQGKQHGQDPVMFVDAGVSVNAIMLYHCDRKTYNAMMDDWSKYLENGKSFYVLGETVDWELHQKTFDPAGPQEVFDRHQLALKTFHGKNKGIGMFWHDLSRAIMGNKGPYNTLEWIVAGATSFSKFRSLVGRFPYSTQIKVNDKIIVGTVTHVDVIILNKGEKPINNIKVNLLDTKGFNVIGEKERFITSISPNGNSVASFKIKVDNFKPSTANRIMIACMLDFPSHNTGNESQEKNFKKRCFDFKYIRVVSATKSEAVQSNEVIKKEIAEEK